VARHPAPPGRGCCGAAAAAAAAVCRAADFGAEGLLFWLVGGVSRADVVGVQLVRASRCVQRGFQARLVVPQALSPAPAAHATRASRCSR